MEGLVFPEEPRWYGGKFWFSDHHGHKVRTIALDGTAQVMGEFDDEPAGIGFLVDGTPLVVLRKGRLIVRLENGQTSVHADLNGYDGAYVLNDMVVDGTGRAYVDKYVRRQSPGSTDDLGEAILLVQPDGQHRLAATALLGPNGMAITPDGKTLIVSEPPAHRLTAFSIEDDGTLAHRRLWADLGENIADGICLDQEGAVWIGAGMAHQCMRVLEGGKVVDLVSTGDRAALACVLGGADRRTLFMATAKFEFGKYADAEGFVEVAEVEVPGAGWP
jgi:sugar lactone lactonase YvrE